MTASGKQMFIPCLEDKYDGGDTGMLMDTLSSVSSSEHETGSNYCFLSQESVDIMSDLMEQLAKV